VSTDLTPAPSDQLALVLLPDLPGLVHGIVQVDPFVRIQCDGCGFIYDGTPGKVAFGILTCGIVFSSRRYQHPQRPDRRRLCRSCRAVEWAESA
jgi:hypothetical protein